MSRRGLRMIAYALPVLLLCAALALLLNDLRRTAALQHQLTDMDTRFTRFSVETECRITDLVQDLGRFSKGMQDEIASARRGTGGDVSRMGSRLSGRLAEVAKRLEDVVAASTVEVSRSAGAISDELEKTSSANSPERPRETALHEMDSGPHAMEIEADTLFNEGRYREASITFALIVEKQPANVDLRLKRAVSMFKANPGDTFGYSTIERELRSALEIKGEVPMALEALALLAAEKRDWPKASTYFGRLLAVAPRNGTYRKEAGECFLAAGNLGEAKTCIEEALRLFPRDEEIIVLAERIRGASSIGGPH